MNVSSLTEKSKTLISDASNIAVQNRNAEITEFHMVDAMVNNENNLIYQLLKNMGVNVEELKENIENEIRLLPKITGNVAMRFSQEVEDELQESEKQAKNMKDEFISVEHIMLGIMEKCTPKLGRIFKLYRIDKHRFLIALKDVRGNVSVKTDTPENTYDVLLKFGKDVTDQARNNKLDPVIGRDEEIRNVMRILTRKTKNNPVLIGEPGVGKTAIVEGLAQRIVRGDVPTSLKDKHIYSLDLGLLVAGAKYKGEFEERLTSVMNELDKSEGNILLFIDEIHNLVGAGKSEGAMDASNLLKPKLSRGELHCMGATTLDEYREYIEKDPALARRFQPVMVNEPTVEDTITILRGIQEKFEIFHGVKIQDQALIAAATLSNRYITDRFLPDKAIDLIDEACAMVRTEMESMPIELDEISRKIMQHEIEEAALEREEDNSSKDQLAKVQKELAELRDKFTEMKAKWEEEKKNIARVKALKEQIDVVNAQIEQAERNYDLNKAAELKYSTLPNLKTVLEQEEKEAEVGLGHLQELTVRPISIEVRNESVDGIRIKELRPLLNRKFVISRIKHREGGETELVNSETILHVGDIILVISTPIDVEAITVFFGKEIKMEWEQLNKELISRRILITKPELNGKTLSQLKIRNNFGANITRVNRSGVDLVASPQLQLQMGDRVTIVGSELAVAHAEKVLGNSMKRLNHPNLIPIFIGIALGCILGSLPFAFPGIPQPVKLGLAGGPLIVSILISRFGPKYKLITYTTMSANLMLREIGISIFLACVGLGAGEGFVDTVIHGGGYIWVGYGVIITILPLLITGLIGRYYCKLNYFTLIGVLAGSTTNPPALAYSNDLTSCDAPAVGYATVYPLTMFLRVLTAQILILSLG